MYGNYMDSNILGLEAVSLVERSNIQCPFLGVSFIRGSTVIYMQDTSTTSSRYSYWRALHFTLT